MKKTTGERVMKSSGGEEGEMCEIVKRKKKGRPSKADLARRAGLAAAPAGQEPERRRSLRRRNVRYNFDVDDYLDEDFEEEEEDEDEEEEDERRREKKVKLVVKLEQAEQQTTPRSSSAARGEEDDEDEEENERRKVKKRIINNSGGRGGDEDDEVEDNDEDDGDGDCDLGVRIDLVEKFSDISERFYMDSVPSSILRRYSYLLNLRVFSL